MDPIEDRSEIAFFDVETTVPTRPGQGFAILEFGAILVCPRTQVELESYSTLVRPANLSLLSSLSVRCNGITRDAVISAPTFGDISDTVYELLDGRIWVGHNILRFDCPRIREAFAGIGKPAPEPKGTIDSLALLTQKFGRRAGNMKLATLATYFGLGQQTHRSLDDVRMNLEVVKCCASVLLLESSLPDMLGPLSNEMKSEFFQPDVTMEEEPMPESLQMSSTAAVPEGCSASADFLKPDEVSIPSISASLVPFFRGNQRIKILHKDVTLQLSCTRLKVRFGLSTKFVDHAGRPRLSFVVDISPSLCQVLDACDDLVQKLSVDSGSSSEWRSVVFRKNGFFNSSTPSTVRLHIPTVTKGDIAIYATEIHQKESTGNMQRLVFGRIDAAELDSWFVPGTLIDACFSVDPYDYKQKAGIRLVAKKLIIHSK